MTEAHKMTKPYGRERRVVTVPLVSTGVPVEPVGARTHGFASFGAKRTAGFALTARHP